MKHIVAVVTVALLAGLAWGRFRLPIEMEEEQRHEYLLGGSMRWKYGQNKGPSPKKGATNGTIANTTNSTNYVSCHLQLF